MSQPNPNSHPTKTTVLTIISDERGLLVFMRDPVTKTVVSPVLRITPHRKQELRAVFEAALNHQGVFNHVSESSDESVPRT